MGLLQEIGSGVLGVVLLIVAFIILIFGIGFLFFGQWIIGLILIILGSGIAIVSRRRIYGH